MEGEMKLRTVKGLIFYADKKKNHMAPALVTVRVSADKIGKSLSLAVEDMGLLIEIPVEPVEDMVGVRE